MKFRLKRKKILIKSKKPYSVASYWMRQLADSASVSLALYVKRPSTGFAMQSAMSEFISMTGLISAKSVEKRSHRREIFKHTCRIIRASSKIIVKTK